MRTRFVDVPRVVLTAVVALVVISCSSPFWGFAQPPSQPVPSQVLLGPGQPVSGATAVALSQGMGQDHYLVLRNDGSVLAWGDNRVGQLGDGTTTTRSTPAPVRVGPDQQLAGITAVATGMEHSLARGTDGTVWAWGYNAYGQLGDGTTTQRAGPVLVKDLSAVRAIGAGMNYSIAVKNDGTVWAWGENRYAGLGDGTTTDRHTPVQVPGLQGVVAVSAGDYHTLALKADGTVWAWGYNAYGQLGDRSSANRKAPVRVALSGPANAVAAGAYYSMALLRNGTVWAWGDTGKILGGSTPSKHVTPFQIPGLSAVTALAAGRSHFLAITANGMIYAAGGDNGFGQLGDGTTRGRKTPGLVLLGPNQPLMQAAAIGAGADSSVAVLKDGSVWEWGALHGS